MPTWIDNIRKAFTGQPQLKSVYVELQPDNRFRRVMITDFQMDKNDYFQDFVRTASKDALGQKYIPDNLLLHFDGVLQEEIPAPGRFFVDSPDEARRFILKSGGITDDNCLSLRVATYMQFKGIPIDGKSMECVRKSESFRRFDLHEDAIERRLAGKSAKMFLNIVRTEQGAVIFSDGLDGQKGYGDFLQHIADHFFSDKLQGMDSLDIYRIETESVRLFEKADRNMEFIPEKIVGPDILQAYIPSVKFDLAPTPENLNRLVTQGGLELSTANRHTMTLMEIAEKGSSHLLLEDLLPYRKDFLAIEKEMEELRRGNNRKEDGIYKQKMEMLRDRARRTAKNILTTCIRLRKPDIKPSFSEDTKKNSIKRKKVTPRKQVKNKL